MLLLSFIKRFISSVEYLFIRLNIIIFMGRFDFVNIFFIRVLRRFDLFVFVKLNMLKCIFKSFFIFSKILIFLFFIR